jgi:putative SOS response-associated peptidase YedK
MCGRFVRKSTITEISNEFDVFEVAWEAPPSYNIAPTQDVACVIRNGKNRLVAMRWGLVPFWAEDPSIGNRMINARVETITEKKSFAPAFKSRRCLIVADGFYEWRTVQGRKEPIYISLRSGKPFGLAGLYDNWKAPDGTILVTCTIITTEPNELLRAIHSRMPAIIAPDSRLTWLDKDTQDPGTLLPLLKPFDAAALQAYPVSTAVNSPKFNTPECIKPAGSVS